MVNTAMFPQFILVYVSCRNFIMYAEMLLFLNFLIADIFFFS